MKCSFGFSACLFFVSCFSFTQVSSFANGGVSCLVCTGLVAMVEQMSELRNATIADTFNQICDILPPPVQSSCKIATDLLGPSLIRLIVLKHSPDAVCHAVGFCHTDPGHPTCRSIEPSYTSKIPFDLQVAKAKAVIESMDPKSKFSFDIRDVPGIKQIFNFIKRFFNRLSIPERKPKFDFDGDGFSTYQNLRGSFWKGKDCSDISSFIHPGAKPVDHDMFFDSNCNGIYGINKKTLKPYEDELCSSVPQRGIAVVGDSISAHLSFPSEWIDVTQMSVKAFKHLFTSLENEADWPMLSTVTGHGNNNWSEVVHGPVDSFYKRFLEHNRCLHRDYQNVAVNGAQSFSTHKFMKALSRNPEKDYPLFLVLSLVGNDVCFGKGNDLAGMTTPEEFFDNTMVTLKYLEKHLPNGSHIMIVGNFDGRILFDTMHARIHPLGTFWNTFKYSDFYDFLNCLDISPCPSYLNSNETIRNMAFKRATELNDVLQEITIKYKKSFTSFQLMYMDFPFQQAINEWVEQGGEAWQLISLSDGFHTSQWGQVMVTRILWDILEREHPDIIGPPNPNNDLIKKIFGDQGGY